MCSATHSKLFGKAGQKVVPQLDTDFAFTFSSSELEKVHSFETAFVAKHDTLQGLKRLLVSFGDRINSVKTLQHIDSPLRDLSKLHKEPATLLPHFNAKCELLQEELEASLDRGQAVVIISREMESFADLILVGPQKVFLFQCKQKIQEEYLEYYGNYDTQYDYELFKMACLEFAKITDASKIALGWLYKDEEGQLIHTRKSDKETPKTKYRGLYLEALKQAAAGGGPVSDVEVHAIFMVECPKKFQQMFKNKFTDDLNLRRNAPCKTETNANVQEFTHAAKVHLFVVHRSKTEAEKNKIALSSFFPVPQTSELLSDSGKSIVVGEHVYREDNNNNNK
jgi:hypothetical protein